jgi:hypothetical protein
MKVLKFNYAGSGYAERESGCVVFLLQRENDGVLGVELSVDDAKQLAADVAEQARTCSASTRG